MDGFVHHLSEAVDITKPIGLIIKLKMLDST